MLRFLGIGAQKAGTTWLYSILNQHPNIAFPAGKEAHFWNNHLTDSHINSYFSHFQTQTVTEGEITPAYSFLPVERIQIIYEHAPSLRLIYIVRNPIERAWSSALMALSRAEMELSEASDQWFMDHFHSAGSIARGNHETNLRNWQNVFPPEQLLIVLYDDICNQAATVITKCCQHIGVTPFTLEELDRLSPNKKVFSNKNHQIRPALRKILEDIYRGKITSLSKYLETDLQHWLKDEQRPS